MNYRVIIFILIMSMVTINLIGCDKIKTVDNLPGTVDEDNIDYVVVESGQVVIPLTPFNTLNPMMTNNLSYYYFSKLIFEGLFEFNEAMEIIPNLVESYILKDEGRTIALKLRDDVLWHDGERFTAADVLFTINVLNNGKEESTYNMLISTAMGAFSSTAGNNVLSAKIIDEYNIEIHVEESFSNLLEILTFPIIPEHKFNNGTESNYSLALQLEDYTPIGTGPFKFVKYDKHKNITLESNEYYWKGKPSIASINGKVLANEELFITAYEAGQLNITPALDVDWDKYSQNNRTKILEYISSDYEFLGFNFDRDIFREEIGATIRKAINYGVDRQEIIQKIYLGHATQTDVPMNPSSYLFSDESNYYGYNKELSKELLASLGYIDNNGDGIVEDEEGNNLSLTLITNPTNELRLRAAEMIREDLKSVGIDIILDFNTKYNEEISDDMINQEWETLNNRLKSSDFDIVLLGWQISNIPELSFLFHSNQHYINNFIKYANPDMDLLLDNVNNSYNKNDKIKAYTQVQKLIIEDLPYVSLYFRNKALLIDSDIKGELTPTFFDPYNGLEFCYIVNESKTE